MTSTAHEPECGHLLDEAAPETVARLPAPEPLDGPISAASFEARGVGSAWNCLDAVPGSSIASFLSECLKFGGWRRRQGAAKQAYDARWAGRGVGERGGEPRFAPFIGSWREAFAPLSSAWSGRPRPGDRVAGRAPSLPPCSAAPRSIRHPTAGAPPAPRSRDG